ncbi:MAG: hypothetical protein IAE85_09270 [Anaerolinea sp.]|nr:hypothetical protein [Anaerolinea sp.]
MAVPDGHRANLETIYRAARNNDLAVMEVNRKGSSEPAHLLVAVARDGDEFNITPLAQLFDYNPYEQFLP